MNPEIETPEALWARIEPDLRRAHAGYPYEAAAVLRAHREALTPFLLNVLEAVIATPLVVAASEDEEDEEGYILLLQSIYFLTEFDEKRAYPLLMAALRLDEKTSEVVFGDFVTESLPQVLAALCDGDLASLESLAEDGDVCPWTRNAAIRAIVTRVWEGDLERVAGGRLIEAIALREAEIQRNKPEANRRRVVLTTCVHGLADVQMETALPHVRQWFAEDLVDPDLCGNLARVERLILEAGIYETRRDAQLGYGYGYLSDAVKELEAWSMFRKPGSEPKFPLWTAPDRIIPPAISSAPLIRETPKVGRNDPCSCGSGKKFKKCCGA